MRGEIVVVTGSSGCLGYHTVKLLISDDDQVQEIRCLDLVEPEDLMKKQIEETLDTSSAKSGRLKKIKWIKGDVRDINVVEQALTGADCVIHCAAKIDVWTENSEQDVVELESINIGGTENLLRASIRLGVHKFIHVSSFEVYCGHDLIYYAIENTLPENKWPIFGDSARTKREAEDKVRQYSNSKLQHEVRSGKDSLNAVIIRFSAMYGEFDKHFVSKILEAAKFFKGKLQRIDNIWIRHQPIYAANAAWALIKAKQRMDKDQSISGEEFHITDETPIGDPFDFVEPYLEAKGMHVTKTSYPFLVIWILVSIFFAFKKLVKTLDFFALFTTRKDRLQETIKQDQEKSNKEKCSNIDHESKAWYDYVTPQTLSYMCFSNFLNRTKASLRLDYEPLVDPGEAKQRSLHWYKNHLEL